MSDFDRTVPAVPGTAAATPGSPDSERLLRVNFFSLARRHLRTLYRFVRHELEYRTSSRDLIRGELSAEDVIDAALLRAYGEYVRSPSRRRSVGWLLRLTQEQIDTIVAWVEQGAKQGNPSDAPAPKLYPETDGWTIEPDLILSMPEPYFVPDDLLDETKYFPAKLTPEQLPKDRWIKAVEFRPGSSAVHHIIARPFGGIAPGTAGLPGGFVSGEPLPAPGAAVAAFDSGGRRRRYAVRVCFWPSRITSYTTASPQRFSDIRRLTTSLSVYGVPSIETSSSLTLKPADSAGESLVTMITL